MIDGAASRGTHSTAQKAFNAESQDFGVKLHDFFEGGSPPDQRIALVERPDRIKEHLAREGISVEQLEEKVGGELRGFLESPVQTAAEFPIAFFRALAHNLGPDWLSFVPD